ncbi:hypothetical protein QU593_09945 [Rossellomorea marisflavi]|uniref:hypothetical protein n=1 Tax=Rossellomorea marisflavi TaxID=189381 RepID=UPI0025B17324|nr:hypothetical protein [Rossellomorea marisflavi]WJV20725.1 hypothetical protein QU593_09945 [Rossellomorea marisflavi]
MTLSKRVSFQAQCVLHAIKNKNKLSAEGALENMFRILLEEKTNPFPTTYYDLKERVEQL